MTANLKAIKSGFKQSLYAGLVFLQSEPMFGGDRVNEILGQVGFGV